MTLRNERNDRMQQVQRGLQHVVLNDMKLVTNKPTDDYAIDNDVIAAGRRLFARHPDATTWTKRIGYNAVYALGGTLTRTAK